MKTSGDTLNTLLETLSQQGDSSAFHSLCEPYLRARYHKERSAGISHQEASIHILADATELFETFVSIPPKQRSQWIIEHCQGSELVEGDTEEVLLDKKIVSETAQFLRYCSHELMKTASLYRRKKSIHERKLLIRLVHSRFFLPVGIPVFIAAVLIAAFFVMRSTDTSVTFSFNHHTGGFSFRFPPVQNMESNEPLFSHLPVVPPADTTAKNSVQAAADTTPPVEKKNIPVVTQQPRKALPPPQQPPVERRPPAPVVRPTVPAVPVTPPPAPVVPPAPQQQVTPLPPPVTPPPSPRVETPLQPEPDPEPSLPSDPVQSQVPSSESSDY